MIHPEQNNIRMDLNDGSKWNFSTLQGFPALLRRVALVSTPLEMKEPRYKDGTR